MKKKRKNSLKRGTRNTTCETSTAPGCALAWTCNLPSVIFLGSGGGSGGCLSQTLWSTGTGTGSSMLVLVLNRICDIENGASKHHGNGGILNGQQFMTKNDDGRNQGQKLANGGDDRQLQRVEFGNGQENKAMSQRAVHTQPQQIRLDGRMTQGKLPSRLDGPLPQYICGVTHTHTSQHTHTHTHITTHTHTHAHAHAHARRRCVIMAVAVRGSRFTKRLRTHGIHSR